MAEFCTIEDVRALNTHRTYDGTSHPKDSEVEKFVRSANASLSAVLQGRGWSQVEASGFQDGYPAAWDNLRQIASLKAALIAEQATTAIEAGAEQSGHVRMLLRIRKGMLDEVLSVGLPGVPADVPAEPGGAFADMVDDDDVDERLFSTGDTY